ncbi:hypothetical protein [Leptothoe spongobia]|uniref:Nucleotidyltransferase family protein n=1 Tax=Leptothoe spongobia TAU-MAC 1115 TaxID=1967444 RepID=A0A947DIX3_9CYAN|nr:hypothetical protein [Leptothoe spongobia]MBT9316836.1 hypothetical protein [Leptothoe spongobia TAU-MAC 1115]
MGITYTPQAEDTSIEADKLVFRLLRQKSNADRLAMSAALSRGARELSLKGLTKTFAVLDPGEFFKKVVFVWLGHQWPEGFSPKGDPMTWIQDSVALAKQLHPIFDRVHIHYYITGGVASSLYGDPRTTRDLDIVLNIQSSKISPLVEALTQEGFYVPGVEDTISGRMQTLQIIHTESILQADLVISGNDPWDLLKFERRQLNDGLYFASPEDVILNKLRWRQRSQSEKQWRDVLGVLKVQGQGLDFEYMKEWAERLGLTEDLDRATESAGLSNTKS